MKVIITQQVTIEREIDVDFPYYYMHELYPDCGDSVIYGKIIDTKREVVIHAREDDDGCVSYEIKEGEMSDYYFTNEHKSTKEDFDNVKRKALAFLNGFQP